MPSGKENRGGDAKAAGFDARETVAEPTLWNLRKTGNGAAGLASGSWLSLLLGEAVLEDVSAQQAPVADPRVCLPRRWGSRGWIGGPAAGSGGCTVVNTLGGLAANAGAKEGEELVGEAAKRHPV